MKLLFISQYVYRPDQAAANRIYDFLQRLAERGHDVHVVAGGVHYLEDRLDPKLARNKWVETRWGKVRVTLTYARANFRRGVVSRLRSYFSFAWYAWKAARRVGSVDAVMVSIQPFFVGPLAWLVAKRQGVPFLLEVRDLWPEAAIEVGLIRSRFLIWLGRLLERFLYRRADHVVTIGYEMKNVIAGKGIDAERISVFPQGFQPGPRPPRSRAAARTALGVSDDFCVMFAGSFGLANNDLPLVIDSALALGNEPGLRMLLIGNGNQKAECIRRCREAGADHVRFLDMVPKAEIHDHLQAADVAVMALPPGEFWKICLQNKIFDYMGNGIPVVAAVEGDQADLLRRSGGGIVVAPGDVQGMVRAIRDLKADPERRERMGEAGRRYIRENLMRTDLVTRYAELVERLVEKR